MKLFILAAALLLSGNAFAEEFMFDQRPCPDQDSRVRPPRPNEWCDYVTKIKRCDGDMAERLFRQRREPAYLMSEVGPEQPRRLVCHKD
ncbi:hypothetical protein HU230_0014265 [Bradyrhizobium quebecense]|uniref:DUF3551 domain-containing protein n=1 Tax=Bradyrhizobium quebecense TaxID=2748629 RepID=A0A973WMD8_9BRAD|nr:hypothetical protein [Bradyrhizobium quebecense]UGA47136.1 hypothetical protein HU230_0014265 [Bradyrhizobium quebecense]